MQIIYEQNRELSVWRKHTRCARLTRYVHTSQANIMQGKYSWEAADNRRSHNDITQYVMKIYGHKRYFPSDNPEKDLRCI